MIINQMHIQITDKSILRVKHSVLERLIEVHFESFHSKFLLSQSKPSYSPSRETPQHGCTYQFLMGFM